MTDRITAAEAREMAKASPDAPDVAELLRPIYARVREACKRGRRETHDIWTDMLTANSNPSGEQWHAVEKALIDDGYSITADKNGRGTLSW